MAWNKYYIMISNQKKPISQFQLKSLDLGNYKEIEKVNLYETNKPRTLFTAYYNNSIIIVHPDLPFKFFGEKKSKEEILFTNCFPDSKIVALIENSTVGLFGFAIIEKGKKIRMKDGADGDIFNDEGEPLLEESKIYNELNKTIELEEKEEIIEDLGEEGFINHLKFQSAWQIPNILSKEFIGEYISSINGEKIQFSKYAK